MQSYLCPARERPCCSLAREDFRIKSDIPRAIKTTSFLWHVPGFQILAEMANFSWDRTVRVWPKKRLPLRGGRRWARIQRPWSMLCEEDVQVFLLAILSMPPPQPLSLHPLPHPPPLSCKRVRAQSLVSFSQFLAEHRFNVFRARVLFPTRHMCRNHQPR